MKKTALILGFITIFAAGCQPQSSTQTTSTQTNPPAAMTQQNGSDAAAVSGSTSTLADACTVFNADMAKSLLGLDVAAGVSKPSYIGGSTCEFTGNGTLFSLQIGKKMYYNGDNFYPNSIHLSDFGDGGFYQEPNSGNANIQVLKGDTLIYFNVYSKTPYTSAQLKAAAKAVFDKM